MMGNIELLSQIMEKKDPEFCYRPAEESEAQYYERVKDTEIFSQFI